MEWALTTVLAVLAVVQAWLTKRMESYADAFGKKEGEIDAIQHNLGRVVEQQRQQTEAVKAIEARIGGHLWSEQERWRLRRDTYVTLLEYWTSIALELDDTVLSAQPDWSAYWRRKKELDRRPEYVRARALSHLVFSEPVLKDMKEVEDELSKVAFDRRLWDKALKPNTAHAQMVALIRMGVDHHIDSFAAVAGEDLAAFGDDAQAQFRARRLEHQRFSDLFDRSLAGEELPPEDAQWLNERLRRDDGQEES